MNMAIESKRREGVVGSSLEAKVLIRTNDENTYELLKKYLDPASKDSLKAIFIVSRVELKLDKGADGLGVDVSHADGKKCPRCWNWSEDIAGTGEICGRCREAINEN